MNDNKIRIELLPMADDALGLIIPYPTGVIYEHQAGARRNLLRSLEGFYVPLFDLYHGTTLELVNNLYNLYGEEPGHMTADGANIVDQILSQSTENPEGVPVTSFLSVNREELRDSYVGWIHVLLRYRTDYPSEQSDRLALSACNSIDCGGLLRKGVLVFQN